MSIWHLLWIPVIFVFGYGVAACLGANKVEEECAKVKAKLEVEAIKWKNVAQAWLDEAQRLTNELKGKQDV